MLKHTNLLVLYKMRNLLLSWIFFISIYSTSLVQLDMHAVPGQHVSDQQSLLLQLKDSLIFNRSRSKILVEWNQSSDCCTWEGITCEDRRVTGLSLRDESISGGIENSTLWNLIYLKSLDLSLNLDLISPIPSSIGNLTNLSYLNLSYTGFEGQIPIEMSMLTRLVTLDLSTLFYLGQYPLKLESPNLSLLVQNITKLEKLYLDGVNISAQGHDWGQVISTSLPNLRELSLLSCSISGPIDQSIAKLHSLSVIRLGFNNLSAPVPGFFANFSNLTTLHLFSCRLYGTFPKEILQVKTLRVLDISYNELLGGSLPEFSQNNAFQSLEIAYTSFSGQLPTSIGNLRYLSNLDLSNCQFNGTLPNSFAELTQLAYLVLSFNNFTGSITSIIWKRLVNLVSVDLRHNFLTGSIPFSLFELPSTKKIQLSFNQFFGQLYEFSNASFSMLDTVDLRSNNLQGTIPMSIFKLAKLSYLSLSSNNFSGTLQLEMFRSLANLTTLDLSYNMLFANASFNHPTLSLFPNVRTLKLASCKLRVFPYLKKQSKLVHLDLSHNQIHGEIPNWIWAVGNGSLSHLNLSHNHLVSMQEPYSVPSLLVLDLHLNHLHGMIPILPLFASYIDLSSNNFRSSIPVDIGKNLSITIFFSLSNNSLRGVVPESICNASDLKVLDLSKNSLSGNIPWCIFEIQSLGVLNLQRNNFNGPISDTFSVNCSLKTLDLNENILSDKIPKSLANCSALEVLDLGNNQMIDTFPLSLRNISTLRILVLRSNKFYGRITCTESIGDWPAIQIVDLASNNFSGELPGQCMAKWHAMMFAEQNAQSKYNDLRFEFFKLNPSVYYQDTVAITNKGLKMELVKILTLFTSIDFSSNNFRGGIPKELGQLKSLKALNLSNNVLSGQIPSSFGNLRELESLDLSRNHLSGTIPQTLSELNFLSFLNLSYNHLVGRIPSGNQIQTLSADGFEGNEGLCGPPLTENCTDGKSPETSKEDGESKSDGIEIEWNLVNVGVGYLVGLGNAIGPIVFWRRWRNCYFSGAEDIAFRILPLPLLRKWMAWKMGKQKRHRIRGRRRVI